MEPGGRLIQFLGDYLRYADRLRHLATDAHFVIWGPVVENQPGHYLCCDNDFGARLATRHMLAQGRRKIAFVGGASDQWPEFKLRHRGYTEALHEAGLGPDPRLRAEAQSSEAAGYSAGVRLLDSGVPFDAVFAASDLIAMGAIHALQDRGLTVPNDVAVIGFDDIVAAADFNPPLTTVRRQRLAGELLVDNLIRLIEGRAVELTAIVPELVIRASCGRPSAA